MPEQIAPEVSVVIASHRPNYIRKCVEHCLLVITGKIAAEIVVVADYPIDDAAALYPDVQWLFCSDKSIPKKRNLGINRTRGRIVGFIDDDCIPLDNWVNNAVSYFRDNPEHAGVAGNTAVETHAGTSSPVGEFKRLEMPSLRTNNIFYRKDILLKTGGFDERFLFQREDIDLAFSILEQEFIIGHCPGIRVVHACRDGERWDLLKNCINRQFDPLLFKKHKHLYRIWISTPFTPSIGLMLLVHGLLMIGCWYGGAYLGFAVLSEVLGSLAMSARRNRHQGCSFAQILRDSVSYMAAPFVLLGALVHGSIKYRQVLLF